MKRTEELFVTAMKRLKPNGMEEIRLLVQVANSCAESTFDDFTAEEVLKIFRACWASKWDLYPDQIRFVELKYAAKHGKLSERCNARLNREWAERHSS